MAYIQSGFDYEFGVGEMENGNFSLNDTFLNQNHPNFTNNLNIQTSHKAIKVLTPVGHEDDQIDYIFDRTDVRTIFLVLYTIVFCCCFFGNLMVILVVSLHWRMRSITNFCLANLAFADLCVGIFCVYQNIVTYLMDSWVFGEFMCKMYHFINSLSTTASVLILVVICIERYLAIIHPITCKQKLTMTRLRVTIVLVWILSAAISSPRFYYFSTISMPLPHNQTEILCLPNRTKYNSKLMDMICMTVLFLIPLAIISILYTRIGIVLWRSSNARMSAAAVVSPSHSMNSCTSLDPYTVALQMVDTSLSTLNKPNIKEANELSKIPARNSALPLDKLCAICKLDTETNDSGLASGNKRSLNNIRGQNINLGECRDSPYTGNYRHRHSYNMAVETGFIQSISNYEKFSVETGSSFESHRKFKINGHCSNISTTEGSSLEDLSCESSCVESSVNYGRNVNKTKSKDYLQTSRQFAISWKFRNFGGMTPIRKCDRRVRITRANRYGTSSLLSRRKVIRMLIVMVLAFALCHLPFHARKVWQYWSPKWAPYEVGSVFSTLLTPITFLIMYANSAVNPIFYAFLSKKFQMSFKDLLCCRIRRSRRFNTNALVKATQQVMKIKMEA